MLLINVPFREKDEVNALIDAGADELYCGYLPTEWDRKFTGLEFERKGKGSNFTDLAALKDSVNLAHKRDIPVYLVLNGLYVNSQYRLLNKIIDQVEGIDFDSFIVADLGLLLLLKKRKTEKKIHISTGGTVFNSRAVDFYKKFGISRVVLDRQVSIDAMKNISGRNPKVEFEAFILNTLCVYIDGFCTFTHANISVDGSSIPVAAKNSNNNILIQSKYDIGTSVDACCLQYNTETINLRTRRTSKSKKISPVFYKQLIDGKECGACSIFEIARAGIKSIKIVGRQLTSQHRLIDTRFIRACLDILKNNKNIKKNDYLGQVKRMYKELFNYGSVCRGNNCYHPESIL